jgi:hypothetical protein
MWVKHPPHEGQNGRDDSLFGKLPLGAKFPCLSNWTPIQWYNSPNVQFRTLALLSLYSHLAVNDLSDEGESVASRRFLVFRHHDVDLRRLGSIIGTNMRDLDACYLEAARTSQPI